MKFEREIPIGLDARQKKKTTGGGGGDAPPLSFRVKGPVDWEIDFKERGAVVAERLRPLTSIPEVPGSNPSPAVASLGKALYPHCLVFRRRL